jgi:GH35 family endo-1,4-beta-xylanase
MSPLNVINYVPIILKRRTWFFLITAVVIFLVTSFAQNFDFLSEQHKSEDITLSRINEVHIKIIDGYGNPLKGATIIYTQTDHDFLFGVGSTSPKGGYPLFVYEKLKKDGINYALPWFSWGHVEPEFDTYNWTFINTSFMPSALHELGFVLNGHVLIWFHDAYGNIPNYLFEMNFEELNKTVYKHVFDIVSEFKDNIDYWTINEPTFPTANALNLTDDEWVEISMTTIKSIQHADPNGKVIINLWPIPIPDLDYQPKDFLTKLIQRGADFDVIGLEFYPIAELGIPLDDSGYPNISWVSDVLDDYSNFNKTVFIFEIAVPDTPNSEAQAEWLWDFYAMAFGKLFVRAIVWYFITDDPFMPGGGLLYDNYKPKPAYEALREFIDRHTTRGKQKTDESGRIYFKGFAGNYNLTISTPTGTITKNIHVYETGSNNITLILNKSNFNQ